MLQPTSSIFRPDAIRNYIDSREKSVLPRFVSPRSFIFLWFLLGLTAAALGLIIGLVQIPIYSDAVAVVLKQDNGRQEGAGRVQMIVCLSPEMLPRLRAGQRVFFRVGQDEGYSSGTISAVEPQIFSPKDLQKRFALSSGADSKLSKPVAVAWVEGEPKFSSLPADLYLGGFSYARVEFGSERVITFFIRSLLNKPVTQ